MRLDLVRQAIIFVTSRIPKRLRQALAAQMSQGVTCGNCGEPITDEPPGRDAAQRKPCPKCGSTIRTYEAETRNRISASVKAEATLVTYPQKLLDVAQKLIVDGEFAIAVVVAHIACEIAVERSLSEAFAAKGISYLEDSVTEFLSGYNLGNDRIRKLYTALTGDQVEQNPFWEKFKASASRRNKIAHSAITVTKAEAEQSYQAAKDLVAHLKK